MNTATKPKLTWNSKPTHGLYIGIDPGVTTGVAFWTPATKQITLHQFKSHCEAQFVVAEMCRTWKLNHGENSCKLVIEDARLAKTNAYFAKKNNSRKDQGVGYVKAYSKDWEEFAKLHGIPYELRRPVHTKYKESPANFEQLTGIKTLKTQSHLRDAGTLVYGL